MSSASHSGNKNGNQIPDREEQSMTNVYLYKKPDGTIPDHTWQHETGRALCTWAMRQPEAAGLLHYNISHSGRCVAVALSDVPVGVDVEVRRHVRERVAARVLSNREQHDVKQAQEPDMAFLQLWTLKECYGKALKVGIAYPMQQVEFIPEPPEADAVWQQVQCSENGMSCFSMMTPDEVLSVCVSEGNAQEPSFFSVQNITFG
jgi:phosphopantetheinyl transferase